MAGDSLSVSSCQDWWAEGMPLQSKKDLKQMYRSKEGRQSGVFVKNTKVR